MRLPIDEQGPGGVPLSRQRRPGLNGESLSESRAAALPDLTVIAERLSRERLGSYGASAGLAQAITLYEWNSEMACAWWGVIGDVEVILRNAMHEQLSRWSLERFGEPRWYLDPGDVFSDETRSVIARARRRATAGGGPELPGRVVAELSLGFWRFLLAVRYERTLWRVCLHRALPGAGLRRRAHDAVHGLHGLRNRIAHHEPIHNRPLAALHVDALTIAGWVCPVTAGWIGDRSRVPVLLAGQPGGEVRFA